MSTRQLASSVWAIARRECGILRRYPIYLCCMVLFPIVLVVFFTTLMGSGLPMELPVGVVDQDHTATTRSIVRKLDAFQTSHVVGHYASVAEARKAIQRGDIYAFLYIPRGTTREVSFYYSQVIFTAGSLLFRDLKTITKLTGAAVGQAKLSALGQTDQQIHAFLQPIVIDLHQLNNPTTDYNAYLSTTIIPACLLLLIFLITAYAIGCELKFGGARELMAMAHGHASVALVGKLLPHTLVLLAVMYGHMYYLFHVLGFPHPGGLTAILPCGLLAVLAAQGFGVFAFGLAPSLRMSMSICSLWAALSFSVMGATFPVSAMDGAVQALAALFPMRHYFMLYQTCILGGHPLSDAWFPIAALVLFACLPLLVLHRIRRALLEYQYTP